MTRLVERLKTRSLPSAFDFVGPKVEDLFDQGLRHKAGKKPYDYLRVWLSMLRPFAYATQDDSWGEMEKLLCIVMRNYVEMSRDTQEAATAITDLEALVGELGEVLEAITAMQALRFGDATATHLSLSVLCETARATLAKLEKARGKDQEHG